MGRGRPPKLVKRAKAWRVRGYSLSRILDPLTPIFSPAEVGFIRLRPIDKCRTRVNPSSGGEREHATLAATASFSMDQILVCRRRDKPAQLVLPRLWPVRRPGHNARYRQLSPLDQSVLNRSFLLTNLIRRKLGHLRWCSGGMNKVSRWRARAP